MGLLEKALERKQSYDTDEIKQETKVQESEIKIDSTLHPEKESEEILTTEKPEEKKSKNNNLFKKDELKNKEDNKNRKQNIFESLTEDEDKILYIHYKRQRLIEEKKGFGYKKLASRRIVYNYDINDFEYQVSEPVLTAYEKKVKKELSYLFKMLADVNISSMDKHEKKEYLENTLEQIVIENDIKFNKKEKKKKSKLSSKGLFSSKKDKKTEKYQKILDKKSIKNENNTSIKQKKIASKKNKEKTRNKVKDPDGKTEKNKKLSKFKLPLMKKEGKT